MKKLVGRFRSLFKKKSSDNKGQALVEYALILVLISVAALSMLSGLGENVNKNFSKINEAFTEANGG